MIIKANLGNELLEISYSKKGVKVSYQGITKIYSFTEDWWTDETINYSFTVNHAISSIISCHAALHDNNFNFSNFTKKIWHEMIIKYAKMLFIFTYYMNHNLKVEKDHENDEKLRVKQFFEEIITIEDD